jgi:hypothetical protein
MHMHMHNPRTHLHAREVEDRVARRLAVPHRLGRLDAAEADQAHAIGRPRRDPLGDPREPLRKHGVPLVVVGARQLVACLDVPLEQAALDLLERALLLPPLLLGLAFAVAVVARAGVV